MATEPRPPNEPLVMSTVHDDGSAEFTVSVDDEDHTFSVSPDGDDGVVSYQETLSWRGEIRVNNPSESVYKTLMTSDEMTAYLDEMGLESVKRVE